MLLKSINQLIIKQLFWGVFCRENVKSKVNSWIQLFYQFEDKVLLRIKHNFKHMKIIGANMNIPDVKETFFIIYQYYQFTLDVSVTPSTFSIDTDKKKHTHSIM